jgi:hypothetical protein
MCSKSAKRGAAVSVGGEADGGEEVANKGGKTDEAITKHFIACYHSNGIELASWIASFRPRTARNDAD